MTEWIWINGEVMALEDATLGVEDRGFQFADGVYEVIRLYDGRPFTLDEHLDRLQRSAGGLEIKLPLEIDLLKAEIQSLIARSGLSEGMVYLQLTRGCSPRNHVWDDSTPATLLFYCRALPPVPAPGDAKGVTLWPVEDERWKRCWIKSIALLPNVLAKNAAVRAGADEAVFIDDHLTNECAASNLFAVIDGALTTAPVGAKVLPGITRAVLLKLAGELGIETCQRAMSQAECLSADELFITSTTRELSWVARWGEHKIADAAGPITLALHHAYRQIVREQTAVLSSSCS